MLPFEDILKNKRVFITGHTGFTGSWACLWLQHIGATIAGYSLPPETSPALFTAAGLDQDIATTYGSITDYGVLLEAITAFQPDVILHLAAQPLVRRSYREPVETFLVNAQGTVHVLEAARRTPSVKGVLCITTDKVYKNIGSSTPYQEEDPLGGKDPYSASKAAAEMVIQSYAASYGQSLAIATARGGNIIGGGDWSEDRLLPDFVRSITTGTPLTLRYPDATRPWQHVLALVHGYLLLLSKLLMPESCSVARAWNFGPQDQKSYSVRDVVTLMSQAWQTPNIHYMPDPLPEASVLALDSSLARQQLGWQPVWNTQEVILKTIEWYRQYYQSPTAARAFTLEQIDDWRTGIAA